MMSDADEDVDVAIASNPASSLSSPQKCFNTLVSPAQSHRQANLGDALANGRHKRPSSNESPSTDRTQIKKPELKPPSHPRPQKRMFSSPPMPLEIVCPGKPAGCLGLGITGSAFCSNNSTGVRKGKIDEEDTDTLSLSSHAQPSPPPVEQNTFSKSHRDSSRDSPLRSTTCTMLSTSRDQARRTGDTIAAEKKRNQKRHRDEMSAKESKANPRKRIKTVEPSATSGPVNDEARFA